MTHYNNRILIAIRASAPPQMGMCLVKCQKCGWLCTVRKVDKQLLDVDAFIGVLCAECYAQTQDEEFGM